MTKPKLDTRFRKLGQRINDDLGIRKHLLRFQASNLRDGTTNWRLENNDLSVKASLSPDMSSDLAISPDAGAALQFYLAEQWRRIKTEFQFHSCNLRFALLSTEPHAAPLYFRLEWAGRELGIGGEYVYPGKGSAHPHWQFDGEMRETTVLLSEPDEDGVVNVDLREQANVIDLERPAGINHLQPKSNHREATTSHFPWFSKLHLPARAMWSIEPCRMPNEATSQQHEPECSSEIDNWVLSALRYMRHEFQQYSG